MSAPLAIIPTCSYGVTIASYDRNAATLYDLRSINYYKGFLHQVFPGILLGGVCILGTTIYTLWEVHADSFGRPDNHPDHGSSDSLHSRNSHQFEDHQHKRRPVLVPYQSRGIQGQICIVPLYSVCYVMGCVCVYAVPSPSQLYPLTHRLVTLTHCSTYSVCICLLLILSSLSIVSARGEQR
eukprot:jgi/Botrbrau1/14217/Bobra.0254s0007.1